MKKFLTTMLLAAAVLLSGCTRIETGEVGVRIGFDKQVQQGELPPGSFNQTLVGEVLTFPVKDVPAIIDNLTPVAADNSTMQDFDLSVIYSVNPAAVAELYGSKARSFHQPHNGDVYLMYNWVTTTARNAAYKEARKYEALLMNDRRVEMEQAIKADIEEALKAENMQGAISISRAQIRSIAPAESVIQSANELVKSKNDRAKKEVEVQTAKLEAERISALNANAKAIDYMNAQANMAIAEGVRTGKVTAVVVPYDFKGIINAGKL